MTKRVLVDVDEVLADFCSPASALIEERFGLTVELSELHHWNVFSVLSEAQRAVFDAEFFVEGRCASLEVLPGTLEGIAALREHAEVVAVTRPPRQSRHWVHERTEWLVDRLGFDEDSIIHTKAKHMIVGNVLVDDSPDNVIKWQDHHPLGVGLMWALPNTDHLANCDGFRVRTWAEVLVRVKAL